MTVSEFDDWLELNLDTLEIVDRWRAIEIAFRAGRKLQREKDLAVEVKYPTYKGCTYIATTNRYRSGWIDGKNDVLNAIREQEIDGE